MTLRDQEVCSFKRLYRDASIEPRADGSALVHLRGVQLPPGWSLPTTDLWFVLPVGYPAAMPDCFWAEVSLRLASGAVPTNSGLQPIAGMGPVLGIWFSWHLQSWNPNTDDLLTFIHFIESRLRNAT